MISLCRLLQKCTEEKISFCRCMRLPRKYYCNYLQISHKKDGRISAILEAKIKVHRPHLIHVHVFHLVLL